MAPANQYGVKVVTLSRDEYIADIAYVGSTETFLPFPNGTFPNDRFLKGISLEVSYSVQNGANPPVSINDDAPFSILDMISFGGFHRPRGKDETFYKVRGATAYFLNSLYTGVAGRCDMYVDGAPVAALSTTANKRTDVRYTIFIPFVPEQISSQEQIGYLLDLPNYDMPKLTLKWGDGLSLCTGGDAVTIGGFGGVGGAKCAVTGVFVMGGADKFAGFVPARVFRSQFGEKTSGVPVDGGANQRICDVPKGFSIRSLLLIAGVRDTTVSAGNFAFATRSNDILTNIKLNQGLDKPIRKFNNVYSIQDSLQRAFKSSPVKGYALIDFAKHQRLFETLPTRGLIGGADGDTDLYLAADVAGAANQALSFVAQEIRYSPQWPKIING